MKLFFDARYIRSDYHDGISRYSAELGGALAALTPVTFLIYDEAQLNSLPKNAQYIVIHKPTSALEPFSALLLNKYHPDVVFSPMQTIGSFGRHFKLIVTLHDLIYYRHRTPPRDLNPFLRLGWRLYHLSYLPQRLTLNAANVVATVSQTSQKDIQQARLTKRPVIVVPNAPQKLQNYLKKTPVTHASAQNLIYMGSFMPYKNVETLVRGMQWLPGRTLHLLSRINPTRQADLQALAPHDAHIVFHNGVSDKEYANLLAHNAVLVSASLDEGYGLPIAEALALGVPAVISDMPIFREVAGEGALYFEATNPEAFAQAVQQLDNPTRVQQLVSAGQAHIHQFNWHTSAKTLLKAIQNLI